MTVAIASGKGGTGKTTVAVNLALYLNGSAQLLDCDVEEPNCHIFLKPAIHSTRTVGIPVPQVDEEKCTACGECGRICQYHAIVSLKSEPLVFPELCHGCGGCSLVCPTGAISEVTTEIGVVEEGWGGPVPFIQGRLHVGKALAPPLIRSVLAQAGEHKTVILDAPPGTSCSVVATVKGSDYVILVTEPTPFGLNDLSLAVEMVKTVGVPFGVVINRSDIGDDSVRAFCRDQNIDILLEIPNDRRIAEAYSRGEPAVKALPELGSLFKTLYHRIENAVMSGSRVAV